MLSVSMKTLISPYLSSRSLHLPKPQPSALLFLTSNSVLCKLHPLRDFTFALNGAAMSSRRSPRFAVSSRQLLTEASRSSSSSASGEIHVIVGPMFAGKTTTLLHRMLAESKNGRRVVIIKSDKDTRYGLESIVTHDGEKLPCWALSDLSSFRQKFGCDAYDQLDVIGVDEAQFFGDLYDFCREAADNDGKTVIVAGLDGDYLRRSFGSVLDIIPLADSVTKLTARCELCGKRAFFTLRKTEETQTELIGGAEVYMPVCRQHYVTGQGVIQTARVFLQSQNAACRLYT